MSPGGWVSQTSGTKLTACDARGFLSVLVPTTRRFNETFYRALVQGVSIGAAVDKGRQALLAGTHRFTLSRGGRQEAITLQDWFLPALYQQVTDHAPFHGVAPPAESTVPAWKRLPEEPKRGGIPKEPRYGFHGRERELLALERAFLPSRQDERERPGHRIVILHGWGGQGKTTLAAEAARWFVRTGLFERAAFVSSLLERLRF